jgi:hypothetical protein
MDEWTYEQGNLQYFQRQMGREQAKIAAWQAKRVSPPKTPTLFVADLGRKRRM